MYSIWIWTVEYDDPRANSTIKNHVTPDLKRVSPLQEAQFGHQIHLSKLLMAKLLIVIAPFYFVYWITILDETSLSLMVSIEMHHGQMFIFMSNLHFWSHWGFLCCPFILAGWSCMIIITNRKNYIDWYKPDNNNREHMITMIIYNNIIVTYQNYNHL